METKVTTKTQTELKEIIHNFRCTITEIENFVNKNNFVRVVNGKDVDTLTNIAIDRSKLNPFKKTSGVIDATFDKRMGKSRRKRIAKRLWNVEKKPSRRSINILFLVLRKLGVIKENIRIDLSKKEQAIQRKRKAWLKVKQEYSFRLQDYKEEKGNFYKKDLVV